MADMIVRFLGTIFVGLDYRELVYTMVIIEFGLACVFSGIGCMIVTGSGYCLGVKYGKTNYLASTIKYIFLVAGLLLFVNISLFWILDFITHMSWGYFFTGIIGVILFIILGGLGFGIGAIKDEKIQKKYSKQIETILFSNPIFKKTIEIINSDTSIKRIHIYRDGIAFYKSQGEIPVKLEETFNEGAWDYDSAKELLEKHKQKWMEDNGTVLKCEADKYLKYSDYGFDDSETPMRDIPQHIDKYTTTDFSRHYPIEKKWLYWEIKRYYDGGGLHVSYDGKVRVGSAGSSDTKTLAASKKATAYVVVMGKKDYSNEKKDIQPQPKKW